MSNSLLAEADTAITVRRVAGRIGAEIDGLTLSGDLSDATITKITAALLAHRVLFFRNQHQMSDAAQEAFSARFGALVPHPTAGIRLGTAAVLDYDSRVSHGRADVWRTNVSFIPAYPKYSVLRGVVVPEFGGDTVWSNTVAAYQSLPTDLRTLAASLRAIHTNAYNHDLEHPDATPDQRRYHQEVFASVVLEAEHPVVRVHPETGERTLLLGGFVKRLVGHSQRESDRLVEVIQSYVQRIENTVRWRWREGDVAIWDNRATQHYAVYDYGDQQRVMRRTTVQGDTPVGVDGQRSKALA